MSLTKISAAVLHQTIDKYNEYIKDLPESTKGLYKRQVRLYLEYCVGKDVDIHTTTNGDATLLIQYFKYCVENKPPGKNCRDNIIGGLAKFFEMYGKTNALNPLENKVVIAILDPLKLTDEKPTAKSVSASGVPLSTPFDTNKNNIVSSKRPLPVFDSSSDDEFIVKNKRPTSVYKKQKLSSKQKPSIFSSPVASETSYPVSKAPDLKKSSAPSVQRSNDKLVPLAPETKNLKIVETKKVSEVKKQQIEANNKRKEEMRQQIKLNIETAKQKRKKTYKVLLEAGELELAKLLNQL